MTFRERRRIGLTRPAIARCARRCAEDGRCCPATDQEAIIRLIAGEWLTTEMLDPGDDVSLDLDAIIEFITQMIELIKMIIEIFSALGAR